MPENSNACVLKGSSDAHDTNTVVVGLMHDVLAEHGSSPDSVFLAPPEREWLPHILQAVGYIDLAIPRGSKGLIDFVRDNASIPVIETGAGIVHTYVDASADLQTAKAIITNAKTRRVSVCNALDTLLLHRDLLPALPELMREMGEDSRWKCLLTPEAYEALEGQYAGTLNRARRNISARNSFPCACRSRRWRARVRHSTIFTATAPSIPRPSWPRIRPSSNCF